MYNSKVNISNMKSPFLNKIYSATISIVLILLSTISSFAGDRHDRSRTAEIVQNKFASGRFHNMEIRNSTSVIIFKTDNNDTLTFDICEKKLK